MRWWQGTMQRITCRQRRIQELKEASTRPRFGTVEEIRAAEFVQKVGGHAPAGSSRVEHAECLGCLVPFFPHVRRKCLYDPAVTTANAGHSHGMPNFRTLVFQLLALLSFFARGTT
eukprot:804815-Pelagomonas_calceolata.AAC.7